MPTQLNASVTRAFDILALFTDSRTEVTAAVVSAELGLNSVTAHRFLKTLEAVGALTAVSKGTYRLGYLLADLGQRALHHRALADLLQPILDRVTRDLGEASMAALFEGNMAACIAHAPSPRWLSVDVHVGMRLEAYCTAHGKLWLANLDEAGLARYLEKVDLKRLSPHTIGDREKLIRELAKIRQQGFATNEGEREEGIRTVAVPVKARGGRLVATLSVFGPQSRMDNAFMERALERLREAAREAGGALYGN